MRGIFIGVLAACLGLIAPAAPAQGTYPTKPIRLIVAFAPGGATDVVGRIVATRMTEALGQTMVVDNRGGGGGSLGSELTAQAVPDGYTLMFGNVSSNALIENTRPDLRIKPSRDLACVSMAAEIPSLFVLNSAVAADSLRRLAEMIKASPGKWSYGSGGTGTYTHLDMLQLARVLGVELVHIPYKSGGLATTGLLTGEIQFMLTSTAAVIDHVRGGRVKGLAVTGQSRVPSLPNVPTMAEAGFPGIGSVAWNGMFAPLATPRAIVNRLNAAVQQTIERPDVKEQLLRSGALPAARNTPDECAAFVRADSARWAKFLREANVRIE
jgi:tripartite-type tricarboxylate transporter receptor subunit TctC